ncbi:MAG: SDR family NAD(P)-dependent oxidoreductase [Dehalococcoidia bacterium]
MKELRGKTAVVTGGGSGIGRGIVLAAAAEGMNVVVADIDEKAAGAAAAEAQAAGVKALAVRTDVTKAEAVQALADRAFAELGGVHLLCNNAGVGTFKPMLETTAADWRWVLAVNLDGVVNGLVAFLPRMAAQEGESHIVNTASTAGLMAVTGLGIGPYTASKYAVVGISEKLRNEVSEFGVGVSVLCPGGVRTNLMSGGRNRPDELGGPEAPHPDILAGGKDPLEVGRIVIRGVKDNQAYLFTDLSILDGVTARFDAIKADIERTRAILAAGV